MWPYIKRFSQQWSLQNDIYNELYKLSIYILPSSLFHSINFPFVCSLVSFLLATVHSTSIYVCVRARANDKQQSNYRLSQMNWLKYILSKLKFILVIKMIGSVFLPLLSHSIVVKFLIVLEHAILSLLLFLPLFTSVHENTQLQWPIYCGLLFQRRIEYADTD